MWRVGDSGHVFLSYAREDVEFVRQIKSQLEGAGLEAWIDLNGVYPGEAFWPEVCKAIDAAAAVVFVLTPLSVRSEFCRQELEYAATGGKRLVPACSGPIDAATVPPELASLQWVIFNDGLDSTEAFKRLTSAIRADWAWLRRHAEVARRAGEWERRANDRSLMLRGRELRDAEAWLAELPPPSEGVSRLQRGFVRASRALQRRRAAQMAASAAGALLALAVTGWLAVVWRIEGWNSAGQTNLEADSLGEAVRGLAAAERVCEFIPLFLERCQAVRMNLAISYRSLKRYDDSVRRFTDVIAVVGTPGPADRDNRVLLADALWGRSISRILLAEEARDDPDRSEQYRLADTDFDQSLALFDEMPDEAAKRPLDVTKARLLIADGAYDEARQALSHWTDANYSDQWLLIQSLALACLGDARQANQLYADYSAQFPDGSTDPRFTRTVSYYNNVRTRCNQH